MNLIKSQSPTLSKRPQIILTKSIGKNDAKVEIINYSISLDAEKRKDNQEVVERELELVAQAAKQLNDLTGGEEDEQS